MASKRAMDRAAFIIEMAEAEEAQRHVQPRQPNERELAVERLRLLNKEARDQEWRVKLEKLKKAWCEAAVRNAEYPETKILLIQAKIASRNTKMVWPDPKRKVNWTEISMPFLSTKTAPFTRLMSAALGVLRRGRLVTGN